MSISIQLRAVNILTWYERFFWRVVWILAVSWNSHNNHCCIGERFAVTMVSHPAIHSATTRAQVHLALYHISKICSQNIGILQFCPTTTRRGGCTGCGNFVHYAYSPTNQNEQGQQWDEEFDPRWLQFNDSFHKTTMDSKHSLRNSAVEQVWHEASAKGSAFDRHLYGIFMQHFSIFIPCRRRSRIGICLISWEFTIHVSFFTVTFSLNSFPLTISLIRQVSRFIM